MGPRKLRVGVPDLLGPGVDVCPRPSATAVVTPRRWPAEFTGRAIGMDVGKGAVAFDWFDSSTFPVHKGLPRFGSCL